LIELAAQLTHFPSQYRPEYYREYGSGGKETLVQKSFLEIEDRIFGYMVRIGPVVDSMIATENDGQQNSEADDTNYRNHCGNGFGYTTESHLPSAPGQCGGTNKEHA